MKFLAGVLIAITLLFNILWFWLGWVKVTESHYLADKCNHRYENIDRHIKILLEKTENNRQQLKELNRSVDYLNKDFRYLQDLGFSNQDKLLELQENLIKTQKNRSL